MSVDDSRLADWKAKQAKHRPEEPRLPLKGGGGDGTYDGMDSRVARLEVLVDVAREDLRDIKGDLRTVLTRLNDMPLKADLATWRWQWLGTGVALFAIIVGTILGGLAWLDPH